MRGGEPMWLSIEQQLFRACREWVGSSRYFIAGPAMHGLCLRCHMPHDVHATKANS